MKKALLSGLLIVGLTIQQPAQALSWREIGTIWLGTVVIMVTIHCFSMWGLKKIFTPSFNKIDGLNHDFGDFYADHKKKKEENKQLESLVTGNGSSNLKDMMGNFYSKFNINDMMNKMESIMKSQEETCTSLNKNKQLLEQKIVHDKTKDLETEKLD